MTRKPRSTPKLRAPAPHQSGRVRVLESVAAPGATVKYIDQVVRHAPAGIEFVYFSWRQALTGKFDVFHVHWPEMLVRSRRKRHAIGRLILARLFLARLRRNGTPIVRTVHNLQPHHTLAAVQRRFLADLDHFTATHVLLNGCTPTPEGSRTALIPHGDYTEQFGRADHPTATPQRFLMIGRVEPYKGADSFIDVLERAGESGDEARIVGSASASMQADLLRRIDNWKRDDVTVSTRFAFVSDNDLAAEIRGAECVVLPYREMLNSGIALVSLSLGRPILAPRTCVNEELAREAGPGWVILYDGAFDDNALRLARDSLTAPRSAAPQLTGRDWVTTARKYADVFTEAATGRSTTTAERRSSAAGADARMKGADL